MRIFIFILALLAYANDYAQIYSITDSFEDNRNYWWTGDFGGGTQRILDGKLMVQSPQNGWIVSIAPYLVFEGDFTAQVSFRNTKGAANSRFGIVWGYHKVADDYNHFQISSSGYYYISNSAFQEVKGVSGLRTWNESKFVKGQGEQNVLRVEQTAGKLAFYINDQMVFSSPAFRWRGYEIGFIMSGPMTAEVYDYSFVQTGLKINLPPSLTTGLVRENLGPNVNTKAAEIMPRISADGKILYFGREKYEGNIGKENDGEDYYMSTLTESGWSLAKNLGPPVNGPDVDNILSISTDNNTLIFARSNTVWSRTRSEFGWAEPREMGIRYETEAAYFEACLTPDGKSMVMTLRNSGNVNYNSGLEDRDIYVSHQDDNGLWSAPVNLGTDVNTPYIEVGPYMAADGRTLYFGSAGRPGYGSVDMFMTRRQGDGWTSWSEPVNLGPEINSQGFDAYYVVPVSGDYAYMVSNLEGHGSSDIVRIKLPKQVTPDPVMLVSGRTLDARTGKPIAATIRVDNLKDGAEMARAISNPATGEFKFILPFGSSYGFYAVASGYLPASDNIELAEGSVYTERQTDLYLPPIEQGETLLLKNVFFERGTAELRQESYKELDRMVAIMKDLPTLEIEIQGHTDNQGSSSKLKELSRLRATTIRDYIVGKGIDRNRIGAEGFGATRPIEKNDTEAHRALNRRVEFSVRKT